MKESRPLVDKDGEVRELLVDDIRKFGPIAEIATDTLQQKLGIGARHSEAADKQTGGKPDHNPRIKDAGAKAARTHKRSAAAHKS